MCESRIILDSAIRDVCGRKIHKIRYGNYMRIPFLIRTRYNVGIGIIYSTGYLVTCMYRGSGIQGACGMHGNWLLVIYYT